MLYKSIRWCSIDYTFKNLDRGLLHKYINVQLTNPYFYTPLIQLKTPSQEFSAEMRRLKRKGTITKEDISHMTEVIVCEYTKIYNLENPQNGESKKANYLKNYRCNFNPFGGMCDYIVYCNQKKNLVPILFFQEKLFPEGAVAASIWNLRNKPDRKYGFSLQTNGHEWQMFRVDKQMNLEKTTIYSANNYFKKLYMDQYHQQLVLGLIQQALDLSDVKRRALQSTYDYIDYRRTHKELPPGQKDGASLVTRILRRWF